MLRPAKQSARPAAERRPGQPARGDAAVRRHIRQWRRVTAQLQVLLNGGGGRAEFASEAHSLRRQCERLAVELGALGTGEPGRLDARGSHAK